MPSHGVDKGLMGGDQDTQLLQTSFGEVTLRWAWNKSVALTVPGAKTVSRWARPG
jgi:hypothetical protein